MRYPQVSGKLELPKLGHSIDPQRLAVITSLGGPSCADHLTKVPTEKILGPRGLPLVAR